MWLTRFKLFASGRTRAAVPAFRPCVEGLEERAVPAFVFMPKHKPPVVHVAHVAQAVTPGSVTIALVGTTGGNWTVAAPSAGATGTTQQFNGHGTVTPLGSVLISGTLTTTRFGAGGSTSGIISLSSAAGSLSVRLVGAAPVPNGSPATLTYTVLSGKGAFAGDAGSGVAHLQETFFKGAIGPQFTLTFG